MLVFLLGSMTINGIGGFQRTELTVEIDFSQAGLSGDSATLSQPTGLQSLEAQGLPAVVQFYGEQSLGKDGAEQLNSDAWRE